MHTWLDKSKGLWKEELPSILWAYHCWPQTTTKKTLFQLTYGADAILLFSLYKYQVSSHFFHTLLTHVLLECQSPLFCRFPSYLLNKRNSQFDVWDLRAHIGHIHRDVGQLRILVCTQMNHFGRSEKAWLSKTLDAFF